MEEGMQEETREQGGNPAAYTQKVNLVVVARIETTTTTTTTTDTAVLSGASSPLAVASPSDASSSFSLPPPVPHLHNSILPPLLTQLRKLARRKLTCSRRGSPNPVSHTASSWQRSMAGREPRVLGAWGGTALRSLCLATQISAGTHAHTHAHTHAYTHTHTLMHTHARAHIHGRTHTARVVGD